MKGKSYLLKWKEKKYHSLNKLVVAFAYNYFLCMSLGCFSILCNSQTSTYFTKSSYRSTLLSLFCSTPSSWVGLHELCSLFWGVSGPRFLLEPPYSMLPPVDYSQVSRDSCRTQLSASHYFFFPPGFCILCILLFLILAF